MNVVTFSFKNLKRRKMRTSLAILGIALGVMLITSLLFIMDGLESSITGSLELLSGNLIVQEKGAVDQARSMVNASLIKALQSNKDIKVISPEIYVVARVPEDGAGPRFITLIGVTNAYRKIVSSDYIKIGTFFNETDSGKMVIGSKLAKQRSLEVGDAFPIDSVTFDITGIFETNTLADAIIALIPLEDARALRSWPEDALSVIEVKPVNPDKADEIRAYVESNFKDYEVVFPEDLVKEATEILNTLRDTVWLVSAIAVIIGGIGIANAMLMSVMERTPEIGLLKATGWRNIDVGYSVLIEALGIGVIGGLIGLLLGMVAAQTAQNIIPALTVRLTLTTIIQSLIFGIILSLGSGVYPAVKAARLSPIKAIRGE
ncbi:hypothetical protein DRO69_02270 [Candidatus Bathyarchaeota archaeon]|nr:MAG: hypothetical protein DRO69_02270 [Candidatus Bathyarchaeota archaeon]